MCSDDHDPGSFSSSASACFGFYSDSNWLIVNQVADQSVVAAVTQDVQQAGAMLQDMLAEVVNGSDVAKALANLLEEETPTMAELRHGSKLSQAAVPLPAAEDADEDPSNVMGIQEAAVARDDNHRSRSGALTTQAGMDSSSLKKVRQGSDEDGVAANTMLQQPDFQAFAEFVLDSACFSLLQESAAGKWQPPSVKLSPR